MSPTFEPVEFEIFEPYKNEVLWFSYMQGLQETFSKFGVDKVILEKIFEKKDDSIIVILVSKFNIMAGGIRLELRVPGKLLPIEKIKSQLSIQVREKLNIHNDASGIVAELSGLWVLESFRGHGLAEQLILKATQEAAVYKIKSLVALPPKHTLDYFLKLGYVKDPDIQPISYPDDRYISTLVWYHVPELLQQPSTQEPAKPPELSQ